MKYSDASSLVRDVARSIENEDLVQDKLMRKTSPEYCETYRRNIPIMLNMAADLLDEAGKLLQEDASQGDQRTGSSDHDDSANK